MLRFLILLGLIAAVGCGNGGGGPGGAAPPAKLQPPLDKKKPLPKGDFVPT